MSNIDIVYATASCGFTGSEEYDIKKDGDYQAVRTSLEFQHASSCDSETCTLDFS